MKSEAARPSFRFSSLMMGGSGSAAWILLAASTFTCTLSSSSVSAFSWPQLRRSPSIAEPNNSQRHPATRTSHVQDVTTSSSSGSNDSGPREKSVSSMSMLDVTLLGMGEKSTIESSMAETKTEMTLFEQELNEGFAEYQELLNSVAVNDEVNLEEQHESELLSSHSAKVSISGTTAPYSITTKSSTPAQTGNDVLFEQNSKQMYDKVLERTPWFARKRAQRKMDNAIAAVACDGNCMLVTETNMYEVVRQATARKRCLQKRMDILDEHKTFCVESVDETVLLMEDYSEDIAPAEEFESVRNESHTQTSPMPLFLLAGKELYFEQNSKQMYDKVVEKPPRFIRKLAQRNTDRAIADVCNGVVVTERDMYEAIRRNTPKEHLQNNLDILDTCKTCDDGKGAKLEVLTLKKESAVSNESNNDGVPAFMMEDYSKDNAHVEEFESVQDESHTQTAPMPLFLLAGKELYFEQNSKQMYDKVVEKPPRFIRKLAQRNTDKAIADVCNGVVVTEKDMYEAIRRNTPKEHLQNNLDILDAFKTTCDDGKVAKFEVPTLEKESAVANESNNDGVPSFLGSLQLSSKENSNANRTSKKERNSARHELSVDHSVPNLFTSHNPSLLNLFFISGVHLLFLRMMTFRFSIHQRPQD